METNIVSSDQELGRSLWNMTVASVDAPLYSNNQESTNPTIVIVGSILCAVIVLSNLLLAASLITGKSYNAFTMCVFHMMALDVVVGACVFPISISYEYRGFWQHSDIVCDFWMTLDYLLPVLIFVTCFVISLERLLQFCRPTYRLWREFWSWKHFLLIWIPWCCALAVGVPLYVLGSQTERHKLPIGVCFTQWQFPYFLFFNIFMYFLPSFIAVVTLLTAVVCSIRAAYTRHQDDACLGTKSTAIALILVTMSTILMMLPLVILAFIGHVWSGEVSPVIFLTVSWMSYSTSAVRPFCWLVDPEIRSGFAALFRKCCCTNSERVPLHGVSLNKT